MTCVVDRLALLNDISPDSFPDKQDLCGMYLDQHTFATNSTANQVMGIELKSRDTVERKISFLAIVTPFHNGKHSADYMHGLTRSRTLNKINFILGPWV